MGQYAHFAFFDSDWEERTDVALKLLREASDVYSAKDREALPVDLVLASWLWVLSTPLPSRTTPGSPRLPLRYFDGGDSLKPPADESCEALRTTAAASVPQTVTELTQIRGRTADRWSEGDPEQPGTRQVLQDLLGCLWAQHFGRRPPSKQYPRGV